MRQLFFRSLLIAALFFGTLPLLCALEERPNILVMFADDWGRLAGAYAAADGPGTLSDFAKTPHFDSIARRGVLFRNAFVNAPSCTPCRSSLLSGQYFWRTRRGAILNGAVWDESIPSFPLLLNDAGYRIGKSYKVWSPGTPADAPFGQRAFAFEKHGRDFNGFSKKGMQAIDDGQDFAGTKSQLLGQVRDNFRQFLDNTPDSKPFCYWFGPTNTHRRWSKGSGNKLWGTDPNRFRGRVPPFLPDDPVIWEDLNDYFGEIEALDQAFGVHLEELEKRGLRDKTLIVVSGDHGPPGFPHGKCNVYDFGSSVSLAIAGPGVVGGRVVDDFVSLPDLAPTLVESGRVPRPDVMTARSLWPLLEASANGQIDPERDCVLIGRERHVDRAREGGVPYPVRSIRTKDFSLIINFRPDRYPLGDPRHESDLDRRPTFSSLESDTYVTFADMDASPTKAWLVENEHTAAGKSFFERSFSKRPRLELYDLKQDPHQLNNVAEIASYQETRNQLESRLLSMLQKSGDPRVIDDGSYYETPPMTGIPEKPK
jgi:N-sulfoglucosamine sulfohydrolase